MKPFSGILVAVILFSSCGKKEKTTPIVASQPQEVSFDHSRKYRIQLELLSAYASVLATIFEESDRLRLEIRYGENEGVKSDAQSKMSKLADKLDKCKKSVQSSAETIRSFPSPPEKLNPARDLLIEMQIAVEAMAALMTSDRIQQPPIVFLIGSKDQMNLEYSDFLASYKRLDLMIQK